MNLEDYIYKNRKKITKTSLAKTLQISRCHLQSVIAGRYRASKHLAYRIESVTNGEVTKEEVLSLYKDKSVLSQVQ